MVHTKHVSFFILTALLACCLFFSATADESLCPAPDATLQEIETLINASSGVTAVDLTDATLSMEDRKTLRAEFPDVHFIWTWELWGVTVSSEDTEYTNNTKEQKKAADLCDLLDIMPGITRVNTPHIKLTRDERNQLFFGYPDVFFYWEIELQKNHVLKTDATAFSTLGKSPGIYGPNCWNFVYCPNIKAIDFGHNSIKDFSFLESCPKLKILIAADTLASDLRPLSCQTDLEYLELFMNRITDLTPLSTLVNLKDLNLAFNKNLADITPLYGLPNLERLWLMADTKIPKEQIETFQELHPDCEVVLRSWGSTGNRLKDGCNDQIPETGWRYHHRYDTVYYIFNNGVYVDWDYPVPTGKLRY